MSSDPSLSGYGLAANFLATEYGTIMARGGRGAEGYWEHAMSLIGGAKTPEQAQTVATRLRAEAVSAYEGTKNAAAGTAPESAGASGGQANRMQLNGRIIEARGNQWVYLDTGKPVEQ